MPKVYACVRFFGPPYSCDRRILFALITLLPLDRNPVWGLDHARCASILTFLRRNGRRYNVPSGQSPSLIQSLGIGVLSTRTPYVSPKRRSQREVHSPFKPANGAMEEQEYRSNLA